MRAKTVLLPKVPRARSSLGSHRGTRTETKETASSGQGRSGFRGSRTRRAGTPGSRASRRAAGGGSQRHRTQVIVLKLRGVFEEFRSGAKSDVLESICRRNNMASFKPVHDVEHWWNSTFHMLARTWKWNLSPLVLRGETGGLSFRRDGTQCGACDPSGPAASRRCLRAPGKIPSSLYLA